MNRKTLREIVMSGLGLRLPPWPGRYYTITNVSGADLTIPDLRMDVAEAVAAEDLYFNHEKAYADANQIGVDEWNPSTGVVTLLKAPTGVSNNDKGEFYVGLPAGEVNAAIDEAHLSLWYEDSDDITLTADQNEINITATITWLKHSGQLYELVYRETVASNKYAQRPVTEVDVEDMVESGAQKLKVYLWDMPSDVTNIVLRVRGKHYYDALSAEDSVTVCAQPLIVAATKVRVLKRLPTRLQAAFASLLNPAQQDLSEARLQFLPLSAETPLRRRHYWHGPEVPCNGLWSW